MKNSKLDENQFMQLENVGMAKMKNDKLMGLQVLAKEQIGSVYRLYISRLIRNISESALIFSSK